MSKNLLNIESQTATESTNTSLETFFKGANTELSYQPIENLPPIVTLVTSKGYRTYKTPKFAETKEGRFYNFGDVRNYMGANKKFKQAPAFLVLLARDDWEMLSKANWNKYKGIFEEKANYINSQRARILAKIDQRKKKGLDYEAMEIEEKELTPEFDLDKVYSLLPDESISKATAKELLAM